MIIHPTVNINGTSAKKLLEQQMVVMRAAYQLIQELTASTPHGRDYLNDDEYKIARNDHIRRISQVSDVYNDAESLSLKLADKVD